MAELLQKKHAESGNAFPEKIRFRFSKKNSASFTTAKFIIFPQV